MLNLVCKSGKVSCYNYNSGTDDYRIGIVSEPILGVSYQIVLAAVVSADISSITAGSTAVNRSLYTADRRTFAPVTRCTQARHLIHDTQERVRGVGGGRL